MTKAGRGFDLTGHRILVSGANGGIGRATARVCAELGAALVLSDVADSSAFAGELAAGGADVSHHRCDIANRAAVEAMADTVGDIDGLVATAGIQRFTDWTIEDWDDQFHDVLDTNVLGPVNLARAWLDRMAAQGYGRMVLLGSQAGRIGGLVASPDYVASKGAVHSLVRWLARRGVEKGVMVNGVLPGPVDTPMMAPVEVNTAPIPIGRMAEPEEIAWPIAFLLSPGAGFVSGELLDVNGALHFS